MLGVSGQGCPHTRGMLFARRLPRGDWRIGGCRIKTCVEAKLLLARSGRSPAAGPNHQTAATEDFRSRAELLFARPARRFRRSRRFCRRRLRWADSGLAARVPLPVIAVVGTPLPCAVATGLAILRIKDESATTVLATALPLAWPVGANGLLRMKPGGLERFLTKTATPQIHPSTLPVPNHWCDGKDRASSSSP